MDISTMIIENNILKAEDGKFLTNGDTFGKVVYLGKNDSVDNWYEIDETEIAEDGGESNG